MKDVIEGILCFVIVSILAYIGLSVLTMPRRDDRFASGCIYLEKPVKANKILLDGMTYEILGDQLVNHQGGWYCPRKIEE